VTGGRDTLLAVVDTGFSQEILTHRSKATEIGLSLLSGNDLVVVADGRSVIARRGQLDLLWHGKSRSALALIVDAPIDPKGGDAPTDCLVGVEMMQDCELLVEFAKKVFLLVPTGPAS
jgi:predicted aspartyl protease